MAFQEIVHIAAAILAVILIVYSVMDFFSLAHQVKLKKEKDRRLISYLALLMLGSFLFSLSVLSTTLWGDSFLTLILTVLALLSMVLAFYMHLKKTAFAYR